MIRNLNRRILLAVPGGLAGQIFAVGYAVILSNKYKKNVHIQFHDVGTNISKFGVEKILETRTARGLGITYSQTNRAWPVELNKFKSDILNRIPRSTSLAEEDSLPFGVITDLTLSRARRGSIICGYPTDYRIIEESWPILSQMIGESGYLDFTKFTGMENSVAIHWRLGDYVGNEFHGAVTWNSLENCLLLANENGLKVRVFSDSLDLAKEIIGQRLANYDIELVANDIWTDLYLMTRSKVFIGTQSGISFLTALSLRHDSGSAKTWLPDKWFRNVDAESNFKRSKKTFDKSNIYYADLSADETLAK
jgi:hypothetical protein